MEVRQWEKIGKERGWKGGGFNGQRVGKGRGTESREGRKKERAGKGRGLDGGEGRKGEGVKREAWQQKV